MLGAGCSVVGAQCLVRVLRVRVLPLRVLQALATGLAGIPAT